MKQTRTTVVGLNACSTPHAFTKQEIEEINAKYDGMNAAFVAGWYTGIAKAKKAGLSDLGVRIAGSVAAYKDCGETQSEVLDYLDCLVGKVPRHWWRGRGRCGLLLTSSDIREAIDEIRQAGLWPWKGSGIE